jgi:hypothetical protein
VVDDVAVLDVVEVDDDEATVRVQAARTCVTL